MNFGKNIRLYLVDGVPNGLTIAEIMNWTGHVMQAPRSSLAGLLNREEISRTGVYILTGEDFEIPGQMLVYIGESDSVKQRLIQHNRPETAGGKDFWDKVTVITSKDANLTKGHVRYLESRLVELVTNAGLAKVHNQTIPNQVTLPEADLADMESFLEQVRIILPVLSVDVLREVAAVQMDEDNAENSDLKRRSPIFEIESPRKRPIKALAQEIDGEFIVKAGSQASVEWVGVDSGYKNLRQTLIEQNKLIKDDTGGFVFPQDTLFKSPSAASAVILGRSANGRKAWVIQATGQTYDVWQASLVEETSSE